MPRSATKTKTVSSDETKTLEPKKEPENKEVTKKINPKDIDLGQYVTVRNGFQGRLVYKSKRTGERFIWSGFGTEQDMELRELKNAKNSSKKFFENNWFMFDEDWIVDFLGVSRFYKNAVSIDDFDKIFQQSTDKVVKTIESMSEGQRKSAAYRARQLIAEGKIDSLKTISALEKALGIELVEK